MDDYDGDKSRGDDYGVVYYIGGACACCCFFIFIIWLGVLTFQQNDLSNRLTTCCAAAGQAGVGANQRAAGIVAASNGAGAVRLDPAVADAVQRGNNANSQRWSRLPAARDIEDEKK